MHRVLAISLRPSEEQAQALLATIEAFNAACNHVSRRAWECREFNNYRLRRLCYGEVRTRIGLPAQLAQHAISKVAAAYRVNRKALACFRPHGAVTFDRRVLRLLGIAGVSMTLLAGREKIALATGDFHADRLRGADLGETDLTYDPAGHRFRLHFTLRLPDPPLGETIGFLGVDLGIVNLAVSSDGEVFSSRHLRGLRHRHRRLRTRLQKKGTKAARRLLKRRRRKEGRMGRHINHCVSKQIVAIAQGTGRGIALEDLSGIRERITVRRGQRAAFFSWSFFQLRQFITYKAAAAGVPVVLVDPRNSSRTCPACGHVDRANRPDQVTFCCVRCRFAGHADHIAAVVIGRRAAVSQPDASEAGLPVAPGASAHRL